MKTMTTKELLDFVATPLVSGKTETYTTTEAVLSGGGFIRTHRFCFEEASPVKGKRSFWHQVDEGGVVESEKRIMETYGDVVWGVYDP
jgi:hypothetical protein